MKEKVLKIMKPLFASKGFKSDELESIADILISVHNLTEETTDDEIKSRIEGFAPVSALMQRIGNRYASGVEDKYKGWKSQEDIDSEIEKAKKEAVEAYKKTATPPAPIVTPAPTPNPTQTQKETDPVPPQPNFAEWFSKMQEQQKAFQEELQKQTAELISKNVSDALQPYREKNERERLHALLISNDKVKAIPESFRVKYTLDKEENLESLVETMTNDYEQLKKEILASGEFATPPASGNKQTDDDIVSFLNGMAKEKKE